MKKIYFLFFSYTYLTVLTALLFASLALFTMGK